jgi:1,4-alpha-glucan branching enzyme
LNHLYRTDPAMHEMDFDGAGFQWIDFHDADNSVISYLRKDKAGKNVLAIVCNFTPVPRHSYRVGVPAGGQWTEILNSDATEYSGSGQGNLGAVDAVPESFYGKFDFTLSVTLPPLAIVVFKRQITADSAAATPPATASTEVPKIETDSKAATAKSPKKRRKETRLED